MKMSEVRKGVRVKLSDEARARHTLDIDVQIDLRRAMLIPRDEGTMRSPKPVASRPGYEEGLFAYVLWDGHRCHEAWHLHDLQVVA